MRNIAKKSVIILLVSLVIGAVIGCISRNTVYTENIQAFLGQLNEDKKIENVQNDYLFEFKVGDDAEVEKNAILDVVNISYKITSLPVFALY